MKVLHMYPDVLDLYGDRGNIATLKYRSEIRGIEFLLDTCSVGENKTLSDYDLVFMGGGADREQQIVYRDLIDRKNEIKAAIAGGTQFLLICGAYQLFGSYYIDANGERIEGVGIGDFYTVSEGSKRCIGNILIEAILDGETVEIVGFENHGGRTRNVSKAFGRVVRGHGNDDTARPDLPDPQRWEGYFCDGVIGTYLHGPLLPKNPKLADYLIKKAISRHLEEEEARRLTLPVLDDEWENRAFQCVRNRLINNKIKE